MLTGQIIGAAIEVHRHLGPGLLESAYETCLAYELYLKNLGVEHQQLLPIVYKGVKLKCEYRIDLLVEDVVIVEIKSTTPHVHHRVVCFRPLPEGPINPPPFPH